MELALDAAGLLEVMAREFPQQQGRFDIEDVAPMRARVRMFVSEAELRPGGTVSGPTMFTLADCAFYMATMAMIGPQALTVTTNCSINFLRKPDPVDIIGECRILKLGKTLSTGDVMIYSDGKPDVVAHASLTYAIPPKR